MMLRVTKGWWGKMLTIAVVTAATTSITGCAIHSQSPIKEVAYDFSDADFYDKDYAPSPSYQGEYEEHEVLVPAADDDERPVFMLRQPAR